jgi:hypothetical protein
VIGRSHHTSGISRPNLKSLEPYFLSFRCSLRRTRLSRESSDLSPEMRVEPVIEVGDRRRPAGAKVPWYQGTFQARGHARPSPTAESGGSQAHHPWLNPKERTWIQRWNNSGMQPAGCLRRRLAAKPMLICDPPVPCPADLVTVGLRPVAKIHLQRRTSSAKLLARKLQKVTLPFMLQFRYNSEPKHGCRALSLERWAARPIS